jgi:hypothetical protein
MLKRILDSRKAIFRALISMVMAVLIPLVLRREKAPSAGYLGAHLGYHPFEMALASACGTPSLVTIRIIQNER